MNTKKILVSLCTIAMVMFFVAVVSATCGGTSCPGTCPGTVLTTTDSNPLASCYTIEVNDMPIENNPSVIAGETATIKVTFTAAVDATGVRVKANIEGDKVSVDALSDSFDVVAGHSYTKTLKLDVPFELKDSLTDNVTLSVKIWNKDAKSEKENIALLVQRPSYNPVVKSISTSQTIKAGETFPVDIVLKNLGYNNLDDVYVTVGISALGIEKTAYFGDLVTKEVCTNNDECDKKDTVSGRIFLEVPFDAKTGVYTLDVKVVNDDVAAIFTRQVAIQNNLPNEVIVSSTSKTVAVGENAEYALLLVNPTNDLLVYKVVADSNGEVSSSVDSAVVAVPAGSSKTVTVSASAKVEGDYNFDVTVFNNDKVVDTTTLNLKAEGKAVNPIVVLTVVLAIIFLVLLVVLIVLIGRKPQKTEEFGESYY